MGEKTQQNRTAFFKKRFLEKFATSGHISRSARAAGIALSTFYLWKSRDKKFARRFEDIRCNEVIGLLEDEAWRRGVKGILKPVFYKGKRCAVVREYSDTLLIRLLQANAPEKYREHVSLAGEGGEPIELKASFRFVMPDGSEKTAEEMAHGAGD